MFCENILLSAENLNVFINEKHILKNISFELKKGEVLGLVGESGSGKSMLSRAIMGILPKNNFVKGKIFFQGENILDSENIKRLRGGKIAMVFQQAMSSLNPSIPCGKQVLEMILQHQKINKKQAKILVLELFEKVKLPAPKKLYHKYPHEISGGQQQRILIAIAISCHPQVLIADEPTTALDVSVQKSLINLLKNIQKKNGMSMIFISHNLKIIEKIADKIIVLKKGRIVKETPFKNNFISKKNLNENIYKKSPILQVSQLKKTYGKTHFFARKKYEQNILNNISFALFENETLGLVGNSGCGKSTLAKILLALEPSTSGNIFYKGKKFKAFQKKDWRILDRKIQMVFQDPQGSLNPKMKVGTAILEPMRVHQILKNHTLRKEKTLELLEKVGLEQTHFHRYPKELSGGQQQRIGIARALAVAPEILIFDESVAALDTASQTKILNLLQNLKKQMKLTYIFISHDLELIYHFSDRVMVMQKGKIEEIGRAENIYKNPQSPYTKQFITGNI